MSEQQDSGKLVPRPVLNASSAALVTFAYYSKGETHFLKFAVDANDLWEPEGLQQCFIDCRQAFMGDLCDENEDAWDSWHLHAAQEDTDMWVITLGERPSAPDMQPDGRVANEKVLD